MSCTERGILSVPGAAALLTECLLQRRTLLMHNKKTLCVSPVIRREEVFPSHPSSLPLSFFLMQGLFCFNEETQDTWMDAILGSGLRWARRSEGGNYTKRARQLMCQSPLWSIIRLLNGSWYACFYSVSHWVSAKLNSNAPQKCIELNLASLTRLDSPSKLWEGVQSEITGLYLHRAYLLLCYQPQSVLASTL